MIFEQVHIQQATKRKNYRLLLYCKYSSVQYTIIFDISEYSFYI